VTVRLSDIPGCFGGEIPAMLVTASADGTPNLNHLSQVFRIDDGHVAISNQFFTKTTKNLAENPIASLLMVDPSDLANYRLLLRHERTDTSGPIFESMRRSIDAIAAMTGMADVFALRAAEVLRVLEVAAVATPGTTAG
jgi:adenylate cyclase